MAGIVGTLAAAVVAFAVLAVAGHAMPNWLVLVATLAFAKGLVALGIVALMRGGLVSFGQGTFYCAGAYAAGMAMRSFGISDAALLVALGAIAGLFLGVIIAPLLAGYRGIFFATLTLALSMIVYGILNKTYSLGCSDGLNLHAPRFFGYQPAASQNASYALFLFTSLVTVVAASLCRIHFDSVRGLLSHAARDNEIRVEYLGASVRWVNGINFIIAAALGGIGGALSALSLGHIDPDFAFWTTSGEFVFLAILSGYMSVAAVFVAAILLELVRSFSSQYFPNTWQGALGVFLLLIILFLPGGLGSLGLRPRKNPNDRAPGDHRPAKSVRRGGRRQRHLCRGSARPEARPDRQQRCRQDHLRQHRHRSSQARCRPRDARRQEHHRPCSPPGAPRRRQPLLPDPAAFHQSDAGAEFAHGARHSARGRIVVVAVGAVRRQNGRAR